MCGSWLYEASWAPPWLWGLRPPSPDGHDAPESLPLLNGATAADDGEVAVATLAAAT